MLGFEEQARPGGSGERALDENEAGKLTDLTADLMMVLGRMKRFASAASGGSLHPSTAFSILDSMIRHGCRTVPEIAARRGVARQSIQEVVNRMVENGTIAMRDNPGSRISRLLVVTDRGADFYELVRVSLICRYRDGGSNLRKGDIAAAMRVIDLLGQVWGAEGPE